MDGRDECDAARELTQQHVGCVAVDERRERADQRVQRPTGERQRVESCGRIAGRVALRRGGERPHQARREPRRRCGAEAHDRRADAAHGLPVGEHAQPQRMHGRVRAREPGADERHDTVDAHHAAGCDRPGRSRRDDPLGRGGHGAADEGRPQRAPAAECTVELRDDLEALPCDRPGVLDEQRPARPVHRRRIGRHRSASDDRVDRGERHAGRDVGCRVGCWSGRLCGHGRDRQGDQGEQHGGGRRGRRAAVHASTGASGPTASTSSRSLRCASRSRAAG